MQIIRVVLVVLPLLLSIGAIYAFIPIIIIIILIAAAAGLTRGYDLLGVFGISTLFGFGSSTRGGLKSFKYGMTSDTLKKNTTSYLKKVKSAPSLPYYVPSSMIKAKISKDMSVGASEAGIPAVITSEDLAKPHVAKFATKLEALNSRMSRVGNKMAGLEHQGMLGYDKNYQDNRTPKPSFSKTLAWMLTPALLSKSIRSIKKHDILAEKAESMAGQKVDLQNKLLKAADPAKYNQYWAKAKADLLAQRTEEEKKLRLRNVRTDYYAIGQETRRKKRAERIKAKQKKLRKANDEKFMEQNFVNPRYKKENEPPPQQ